MKPPNNLKARLLVPPRFEPNQRRVLSMLDWIHKLNPGHLKVKISLDQASTTFDHSNWHELPDFALTNCASPCGTVVFYVTTRGAQPNDMPHTAIAGLSYQDERWEAYGISFLKMLPELRPALYADFLNAPNLTFFNLKDLFPDCPVTSEHVVEW